MNRASHEKVSAIISDVCVLEKTKFGDWMSATRLKGGDAGFGVLCVISSLRKTHRRSFPVLSCLTLV